MFRPAIVTVLCCGLIYLAWPDSVVAQDRSQRREMIQDLLKGLLESQLNKGDDHQQPGRPDYRPNRPQRPAPNTPASPEMKRVRSSLMKWNQSAAELVNELRHHEHEAVQLKPLLADALQFQASVNSLYYVAMQVPSVEYLTNDFIALDRQWRILSLRLKQTPGVPRQCLGMISTIAELDRELAGLFKVEPQIDRRELMRLASTLSNDYDHLLRGVYYASRGQRGSEKLLEQGQQLQAAINQAAALVQAGSYESIVNSFSSGMEEWRRFSRRVLRLDDERLRYSVQHIESTGRKIKEQLFLPVEMDRDYMVSLVNSIASDATKMFDSISVTDLLQTQQPGNALALCREFDQTCTQFVQQLNSGAPQDQLDWTYRLLNTRWIRMQRMFQGFESRLVQHKLEDMALSIQSLGEIFGTEIVIDRHDLQQKFAEVSALCQQATLDISRRIQPPQYDGNFSRQIQSRCNTLAGHVNQLQLLAMRPSFRMTDDHLVPLINAWNSLKPMLAELSPADRNYFAEFRRQLDPMMVKLQVVYAD